MKKVLTYGTFDLLHYGHINILKRAKALGDYLVVAISSDEFNAIKGKKSAMDFIREDDADILTHVSLLFANKETGRTALENKVHGYLELFTKLLLAVWGCKKPN